MRSVMDMYTNCLLHSLALKGLVFEMDLPSRVWSAETLDLGISLAEQGVGMETPDMRTNAEIEEELAHLEDTIFMTLSRCIRNVLYSHVYLIILIRFGTGDPKADGGSCCDCSSGYSCPQLVSRR